MARKTTQPDLFDEEGNLAEPAPSVVIPTKEEVNALANKTGESPRKCYFWLVAEKNPHLKARK